MMDSSAFSDSKPAVRYNESVVVGGSRLERAFSKIVPKSRDTRMRRTNSAAGGLIHKVKKKSAEMEALNTSVERSISVKVCKYFRSVFAE